MLTYSHKIKAPKLSIYKITQLNNSLLVSIHPMYTLHQQQTLRGMDSNNITYLLKYPIQQQQQQQKQQQQQQQQQQQIGISQIDQLYVYGIFNNNNKDIDIDIQDIQQRQQPKHKDKQIDKKLIINKIDKQNKLKLQQNNININNISINNVDYAQQLNNTIITGKYHKDYINIYQQTSNNNTWKSYKSIINKKYILGTTPIYSNNIIVSYIDNLSFQLQLQFEDILSSTVGICCYDLQTQQITYNHTQQRQFICNKCIVLNSHCFMVGHVSTQDNTSCLAIHDLRMKNIAYILDSSQDIFGGPSWLPNYNQIYRKNNWNIGTIWGSPGSRVNHIVNLDIRMPIRKTILIKNIAHPKYMYFNKNIIQNRDNQNCWIIRNQYQNYRYSGSYIQRFNIQ